MTMWIPDIAAKPGPRYLAIVEALGDAVARGELNEGDRLLPQREFAYHLGLTLGTVSRAFALAQRRGLIRGEVGRGSYVCGQGETRRGLDFRPARRPAVVDLSCFLPSGSKAAETIAALVEEVGRDADFQALHRYPPASGIWAHRLAGADWMERFGFRADPKELAVCPGAQQALSATLASLVQPGDVVLCEGITYSGMKQLAHLFHVRAEGVAMDDEGILPDALDAACRSSGARVLYVQPSLHNPTTALMGEGRRREIARIAARHDLTVIEDASCAAFLEPMPVPLARLVPERTCLIVGTSKNLSPSLRVAFLRSPADLHGRIVATLHTLSLSASSLMAEVAARLVALPGIDAIVRDLGTDLSARHDLVDQVLGNFDIRHHPAAPYAWLSLPPRWRADDFAASAKQIGVAVVGSENFAVGRTSAPHNIRISVGAGAGQGEFEAGIRTLAAVLAQTPRPQDAIV